MRIRAGTGYSRQRNADRAAREAVEKALVMLGPEKPEMVFLFATIGYDQPTLVKAAFEAAGRVPLTGCSAEGVIARDIADESNFAVTVMIVGGGKIDWHNGLIEGAGADSERSGIELGSRLKTVVGDDTRLLFLFPDGITSSFDPLRRGLENGLGLGRFLPIVGGAAGDNWAVRQTWQFCNDRAVNDGVAWALLSGPVRIEATFTHGCEPIGALRTITRSEGTRIYEIDHQPVFKVLEEYMPGIRPIDLEESLIGLSFGIPAPEYIRAHDPTTDLVIARFTAPNDNPEAGHLATFIEIPQGTPLWITRRDREKIMRGAERIMTSLKQRLGEKEPEFVLQFDCAGRGKRVFREDEKKELLQVFQRPFSAEVPWIGFYTYGEIAPAAGHNCFHNYSAVVLTVCANGS